MFDWLENLTLIKAGGWVMLPIIFCSVLSIAIIIERFWVLRRARIMPKFSLDQAWQSAKLKNVEKQELVLLKQSSPLGRILAIGLINARHGRDIMKESIEDTANTVIHQMQRYLNTLGTIAAISPLLGLLGTVIGMIKVFDEIMLQGTGNAGVLAGGISEALITTAAGLTVAIPALIFHRFFQRRVDELVVDMEQAAVKLVEITYGDREPE